MVVEMADAEQGDQGPDAERQPVTSPQPQGRGSAAQPGDMQSYIGARLRQAFDDVARQPVPDRFLQLMAELDRS